MGKERDTTPKDKEKDDDAPSLTLPLAWSYGLLLFVLAFVALIRVRLLRFPLERDEGEYAYAGQLILHGIVPYRFCYSMKLPGTHAAYALIMALFGQTATGIHIGLLLVNAGATILLYFLANRLLGRVAAMTAGASFALLSVGPAVLGFAAHATQFVVLPALAGVLLLLEAIDSPKPTMFFCSGFCLGLAFLMKQPGIFFVLFALFYLIHGQWKRGFQWRDTFQIAALLAGAAAPFVMTCLIMLKAGRFSRFWFWTFVYARQYGGLVPFSSGMNLLWRMSAQIFSESALIWLIALAGLTSFFWNGKVRSHAVFVLGFCVFSFAAVCPGLYFRGHYFILLLPAVSLLCGLAVSSASEAIRQSPDSRARALLPLLPLFPLFFFGLACAFNVAQNFSFYFREAPVAASRRIYTPNPFVEAPRIADFVRSQSAAGDTIAVLGSEPEIYFYADRRSATGYVYMYPLMEPQPFASTMQKEMISEIQAARPNVLVYVDCVTSWIPFPKSDRSIFFWAEEYVQAGYRQVGVADMFDDKTEYHFGDGAVYHPRAVSRVFVFKRKP